MHGTHTHRFVADLEHDDDGYYYSVDGGEQRGPFPTDLDRERDLVQLLAAWRARAQSLGGSLWRETGSSWLITLPEEHPIRGGTLVWPRRAAA